MFGIFQKKQFAANNLYLLVVKINRGSSTEMPPSMAGALVPAFAPAPDHESAARIAVSALVRQGFEFVDLQGQVTQLDPSAWNQYVESAWPEFAADLPDQTVLKEHLVSGKVFFGPFAGYDGA
jgi:hypothetical protein